MGATKGSKAHSPATGKEVPGPGRGLRVVLATAPASAARSLAGGLVRARLAACVNLIPGATSIYRWKGRVETARETLLVVKTTASCLDRCLEALARAHPYDVPEGLAFVPERALAAYARWIEASTG